MEAEFSKKRALENEFEEQWQTVGKKKPKKAKAAVALDLQAGSYQPTLSDVQNLCLRLFTTEYGENPKWVAVRGMSLVKTGLLVLLPCLDAGTVRANEHAAPTLATLLACKGATVMRSAGEVEHFPCEGGSLSVACRLVRGLLSAKAKPAVTYRKAQPTKEKPAASGKKPPIRTYLATASEMARSGYPCADEEGQSPQWVSTAKAGGGAADAAGAVDAPEEGADPDRVRLVAMDCEMVQTASGLALARLSLVAHDGAVLFDDFVRPEEEVLDHLTPFSGVTAELLEGTKLTLADVQKRLLELVTEETILVGHSLENDFKALQLVHGRVVDTCLIFPHSRGWPHRNGLAGLVSSVLKRKLDRTGGHDSVADARAALELALLKFEKGPGFGAAHGESAPLGRLLKAAGTRLSLGDPGAPPPATAAAAPWHAEACRLGPAEVREEGGAAPSRAVHLEVLREYEALCKAAAAAGAPAATEDLAACLGRVDRRVREAAEGLAEDELLVLLSGCGDLHNLRRATDPEERKKVRGAFKDAFGIFLLGGAAVRTALAGGASKVPPPPPKPAPRREMVTYDCD